MKVSGFTIARNAVKFGYPIRESLRSLLPLVDELVIGVGDSEDDTWDVIQGIRDPKIKAFQTVWDMTRREGGQLLSEQTNLALSRCTGDWAIYLQSDEVLHEDDLGRIRTQLGKHLHQPTEALSFLYMHFYGSYETVQDNWCAWYRREVRAVKTGKGVVSVGDAAGFRLDDHGRHRRLIRADSGARVYHYGWARPPAVMVTKQTHVVKLYDSEKSVAAIPEAARINPERPYDMLGHLRRFTGPHPAVMAELVAGQDWSFDAGIDGQAPRWRRYLGMLLSCPRDSIRIFVSRLLLTWNTYIPVLKLR
ncbi:MAG TPA: glycosyltransferase [Candidatus Dormibacteraeota bacterium]|nr:glycosyltransferase [Candidatus Dormibacteraeota bacterium]